MNWDVLKNLEMIWDIIIINYISYLLYIII